MFEARISSLTGITVSTSTVRHIPRSASFVAISLSRRINPVACMSVCVCVYYVRHECVLCIDVLIMFAVSDAAAEAARESPEHNSHQAIVCALQQLGSLVQGLGTAASNLISDNAVSE